MRRDRQGNQATLNQGFEEAVVREGRNCAMQLMQRRPHCDRGRRRAVPAGTRGENAMTKVSWHTALLGGPVYAIRRGHWQPAEIIGRGRTSCRVKFTDTGNCAQ